MSNAFLQKDTRNRAKKWDFCSRSLWPALICSPLFTYFSNCYIPCQGHSKKNWDQALISILWLRMITAINISWREGSLFYLIWCQLHPNIHTYFYNNMESMYQPKFEWHDWSYFLFIKASTTLFQITHISHIHQSRKQKKMFELVVSKPIPRKLIHREKLRFFCRHWTDKVTQDCNRPWTLCKALDVHHAATCNGATLTLLCAIKSSYFQSIFPHLHFIVTETFSESSYWMLTGNLEQVTYLGKPFVGLS